MILTFCNVLIIAGILFILLGIGGTIKLKIPQLGYLGVPSGLILIILSIVLNLLGIC